MYFVILLSPALVSLLALTAIVMLASGNWIVAVLLIGVAAIVNYKTESFALNFKKRYRNKDDKRSFKVLTYNLNRAYDSSINRGTDQEALELIKAQDADIVLLQEFNPFLYEEIHNGLRAIYPFGSQDGEGSRFKSVYSRYPVLEYQQLESKREVFPICSMKFNIDGRICRIVNCHLQSNNFSKVYREWRNNSLGLLKAIRKTIALIQEGNISRQYQVDALLEHLKDHKEPALVCGDFNDVGGSIALKKLKSAYLMDAWWNMGNGYGFTFWGLHLRFRLDHILYSSDNLIPSDIRVVPSVSSDHRPLVATFNIG